MAAPDPPDDEGFLGRWSRRKAEAREPSEEPAASEAPDTEAESASIDPADLPDLDSLDADSDFSVFMRKGVPGPLRTLALRKLWRLNPTLANLDGLVDYGEDLTGSFKVVAKLKSAYEVGKGFLRDEKAAEEQPRTPPSPQLEPEPDVEPDLEPGPEPSAAIASTVEEPPETLDETSDEVDEAPCPRPLPRRG